MNKIIGPEVSASYFVGFTNSLKTGIRLSNNYDNVMTNIKFTLSPFISKQFLCDVENTISDNEELKEYIIHWCTLCNREFSSNKVNKKEIAFKSDTVPFIGKLTQEMVFAYFYGLVQFIESGTTAHETCKNYEIFLDIVSKKFCYDIDDERLYELMCFFDTNPIFSEIENSIFMKFYDNFTYKERGVECLPIQNRFKDNLQYCVECNSDLDYEAGSEDYCNDCRMIQYKEEYDHEYDQEVHEIIEQSETEEEDQ